MLQQFDTLIEEAKEQVYATKLSWQSIAIQ